MGWKLLMEVAASRYGVVSLADADACGLARETVMARAAREGWRRLHPGVYLLPGVPDGPRARTAAAVLAADGYAARRSALWLHGIVDEPPVRPQVVVRHRRRGIVGREVDMVRSRTLRDRHVTEVDGTPTTTVARAILDQAHAEHPRRITSLVLEGERRRRFDRTDLAAARDDLGRGFRGLTVVDMALDDLGRMRSDSGWEHEVRADLARLGLPVHPEPFPYRCEDGVVVELDVAFPDHWVYAECDGKGFHSAEGAFETDRVRWTQVVRHWHPVWVTFNRWRYERASVVADIRRALDLADRTLAPARPAR